MNSRQKEILQAQLNNEKQVLKELQQVFKQAIKDCSVNISQLSTRTDMENIQAIIYQQQYQNAIRAQLETALAQLQSGEYATISDYLTRCYQNGYVGAIYDISGQGIPLIVPIDQNAVLKALQIDSKLSKSLYDRLGEDVKKLNTSIRAEVSRGVSNGSSWNEIGEKISLGMNSTIDMFGFNKAKNNSIRIARTEGHRIQNQSAMDAQEAAKKKGADVLKQWCAALDGNTRPAHAQADGQIKELDEYFIVGGEKMKAPGIGGSAANVCNCRCALLQRARWALNDKELDTLKERAEYFGLDKSKDFEEYKAKYLGISEEEKKLEKDSNSSKIKRGQLDTGYNGKIPDDKLDEYNKKAFEQIKLDTGYSEKEATDFHNSLLQYFGGDYEAILLGETESAQIIKTGIAKMPAYDGSIYRGMTFSNKDIKQFADLRKGDILPRKGIIESWTSNERAAISFGGAREYERSTVILECIDNQTGVGVQHISKYGNREAEVLSSADYEVIEVVIENKYEYLSKHKELLYFPDDLEEEGKAMKENIVCRIRVKEKN